MLSELIPKIAGFEKENIKHEYRHRCSNASIGERCIRQSVYHALGYEAKPFGDRMSLVVDDSSWHEQLTADWLRKSGYKLHSEQMKVTPFEIYDIPIWGSIDGILTDLTGKDYLYEHKAINHFTFANYEKGNVYPSDYICQCVCYIVGLKKVTGTILPAILLIKNKNTANYLEYLIEYDDQEDIAKCKLQILSYEENKVGVAVEKNEFFIGDILKKIKTRFELIESHIRVKDLPQRQYSIEDWQCSYCRYGEICWKGYEEETETKTVKVTDYDVHLVEYKNLQGYKKEIKAKEKTVKDRMTEIEEEIKQYMIKNSYGSIETLLGIVELKKGVSNKFDKTLLPLDIVKQYTVTTQKIDIEIKFKKENGK